MIHRHLTNIFWHILDIDNDVRKVSKYLKQLDKDELKDMFRELGLSYKTVKNKYTDSDAVYADDLICAWILKKDSVMTAKEYPGGPTWNNLMKALREISHQGIADQICEY